MRKAFFQTLFFFGLFVVGFGEEATAQLNMPFGFNSIKKKRNRNYVHFELRSNLIILKTLIDHSDTLNFILDSGVQSTIILDSTVKDQIDRNVGRKILISGIGSAPPFSAFVSTGHTIKIGGILGRNQNVILLDSNFLNLSDFVGMKIHGILGSELFRRFNVLIDYDSKEVVFSDPLKYKYKKRKGVLLELHLEGTKPYITTNRLSVNGKKAENIKLVIDTGGSHALLLNAESIPKEVIPSKLADGHLGQGLSGNIEGKLGRIDVLTLAGTDFKHVIATFPDSSLFSNKDVREELLRQGSIGGEILKRFVVNINYVQHLLVLKPIRNKVRRPFESDMSGLEVKAVGEGVKKFEVARVLAKSPAYYAGILPGDVIIYFNNRVGSALTISDIYEDLSKKEGKEIKMIILRGNTAQEVSFKLKRMI